jgi:hypothetical protein
MDRVEVHEFEIPVEDNCFTTPIKPGHWFFHGDEAREWCPSGQEIADQLRVAVEPFLGPVKQASGWWVVTVDRPLDPQQNGPDGRPMALGDHQEGQPHFWTLLVALNTLPEDAGGEFRLVEYRHGPVLGKLYPHVQGRAVAFPSMQWHGNAPLNYPAERVLLALQVEEG